MIERLQEEEPEHVSKPCPGARWSGREEFVAVFLHGGAIFGVRPRACNIHSPGLQAFLVQKLTNLESRSFACLFALHRPISSMGMCLHEPRRGSAQQSCWVNLAQRMLCCIACSRDGSLSESPFGS